MKELNEKRLTAFNAMNAINDKAVEENRSLTQEEQATWDAHNAEIDDLDSQIARQLRMSEIKKRGEQRMVIEPNQLGGGNGKKEERTVTPEKEVRSKMFANYLREGRAGIYDGLTSEERALVADVFTSGGALTPTEDFRMELLKNVDDLNVIRQMSRVLPRLERAEEIGIPVRTSRMSDFEWTSELTSGSKDNSLKFGKRAMKPHKLSKMVLISRLLMQRSPMGPEKIARDELAYVLNGTQEKVFFNGTGVLQPLGLFTASADGISTGRDKASGSQTDVDLDSWIDAKYSIKAQYQPNLKAIMHRDTAARYRKKKDSQNQYLWQPSVVAGQPDRLFDVPVVLSEYAPNTFTAGKYTAIMGDFDNYWILDAYEMYTQVLLEKYAEEGQIAILQDVFLDAAPVREEAFARLATAP